jgi:hypothetical protein
MCWAWDGLGLGRTWALIGMGSAGNEVGWAGHGLGRSWAALDMGLNGYGLGVG